MVQQERERAPPSLSLTPNGAVPSKPKGKRGEMSFWPWKKKQAEPKPAAKPKPKPKPKADVPAQPASAAGGGMGMGGMDMFAGLAVKTPDKKATMSAPSGPPGGAPHTDATPSKRDVSSAQDPVLDQPTVAAAPSLFRWGAKALLGGGRCCTAEELGRGSALSE